MKLSHILIGSAAVVVLAGVAMGPLGLLTSGPDVIDPSRQIGPHPYLPEPHQYLLPPMRVGTIKGWQNGAKPTVAAGLQIKAFATGMANPRNPYVLPNGDVLVAESGSPGGEGMVKPKSYALRWGNSAAHNTTKPGNRIMLLRDADGDGVAETKTVFLDQHFTSPFGIALVGNDLYIAMTGKVMRYPYVTGETKITDKGVKLADLDTGQHHWTRGIGVNSDGTKLYIGIGSASNVGEGGMLQEKDRAAVWEIDRATGARRVYATGLRNPNGMSFEPVSGKLFVVVNERDELGPDLVPDYLTSVKEGGFYGWPYSYYGQHVDPRVMPQRPDLVASAVVPDYALSSHVAPVGLAFNTTDALGAKYNHGAFVSEHGSWDRPAYNGYKVVFVPFANGAPSGMTQDVVTGFVDQSTDTVHGRPAAIAIDKKGGLLIADDAGNTVWRVTSAAQTAMK
jgi:glucose/arabinose dehydrogenase